MGNSGTFAQVDLACGNGAVTQVSIAGGLNVQMGAAHIAFLAIIGNPIPAVVALIQNKNHFALGRSDQGSGRCTRLTAQPQIGFCKGDAVFYIACSSRTHGDNAYQQCHHQDET